MPFLFLGAALFWAIRKRDLNSRFALVGSGILVLSALLNTLVERLGYVSFGTVHRQPIDGDNAILWFTQYFGAEVGYLVLGVAFFRHFKSSFLTHNKQINQGLG